MPLKDRARRRAYENALRAKQRRAAGVPLQSDPDAIDKQQPWLELNIRRVLINRDYPGKSLAAANDVCGLRRKLRRFSAAVATTPAGHRLPI